MARATRFTPASATAGSSTSKGKMSMGANDSAAASGSSSKPQKRQTGKARESGSDEDEEERDFDDERELELEDEAEDYSDGDDDEPNTDEEIEASKSTADARSKKTAKRKRRATSPTSFGLALEGLLGAAPGTSDDEDGGDEAERDGDDEDAAVPAQPAKKRKATATSSQPAAILSLAPHLRRSAQSVQLNARASRIAIEERRAREERARVKDVIGGWGPPGVLPTLDDGSAGVKKDDEDDEKLGDWVMQGGSQGYERRLRKVAQRGVVKLFNAIRAAQTTTKEDLDDAEIKGSGVGANSHGGGAGKKANALGGKEARLADLSKNNFLDLIRKGTATAKAK